MQKEGSYLTSTFTSSTVNEINRLDAQIELFWDKELQFYKKHGIQQCGHVLDCGSGPGHLVRRLSLEFKHIAFSSLEMEEKYVDYQKKTFDEKNIPNIIVQLGTITENNLDDESFDMIICRLVLEHVPDVKGALLFLRRLLKPNGKLILLDNDFRHHLLTSPEIPSLSILYRAYCDARISEGGDPHLGSKLPVILHASGFQNIEMDSLVSHSEEKGDAAFLKAESSAIGSKLVEAGFMKDEDFSDLVSSWRGILSEKEHLFMRTLYVCSGVKGVDSHLVDTETDKSEPASIGVVDSGKIEKRQTIKADNINRSDIEDYLSEIWKFRIGLDSIDINDNYFDIGGTSIAMPEIVSDIKKQYGIDLEVVDILRFSTVKELSSHCYNSLMSHSNIDQNISDTQSKDVIKKRRSNANRFKRFRGNE